jgi:hypothetical protein
MGSNHRQTEVMSLVLYQLSYTVKTADLSRRREPFERVGCAQGSPEGNP